MPSFTPSSTPHWLLLLAAPILLASVAGAAGETTTSQLPRTVRPTHYDVAIAPHAADRTFDGEVGIDLEVLEPVEQIVLDAVDLQFASAAMTARSGVPALGVPSITTDADAQTATIRFAASVPPGAYRLEMKYVGKIGIVANGLFAVDYDSPAGKKRALFTQFENSDARRLIPSWDEPAYKATFTLTATVPSGDTAISNMPIAEQSEAGPGLKRIRFAPSPKMSTYLLFLGVGDFERATAEADGTEAGVVVQRGLLPQAAFALESEVAILREFNDYFGTRYPLPKLDYVASPGRSQFFGAMENWGAIYSFEYAILLNPAISTAADRQRVFATEAHEISHQWFGDLVTMSWWDDLWLNEGFASWASGWLTETQHPEWNTALATVGGRESAMGRDAVATTHPVVQHVETVEQASQAFDAITYSKGAAVIRMLENYVGADAWRDGVRRYMKAHAYGNTASDDLWREIEAAAGKPIVAIAHDFTMQPGVPLIRVERATCTAGRTVLQLAQGEFTKDRPDKKPLAWRVPILVEAVGDATPVRALVSGGQATVTVPGCAPVVVNAGQRGYYRTLYAPASLTAIRQDFAHLAPIDQLGVLSDTSALGLAGYQSIGDYLDLAQVTPADADPQVWGQIAFRLGELDEFYRGDPVRQARFRAFAVAWLAPVLERLGWEAKAEESDPTTILRARLIGALSALGDPGVIGEARRRYAAQSADPKAVPVALRRVILRSVAQHADAATWNELRAAARVEKSAMLKDELYGLLASAEDATLARQALELALTDEPGNTNGAAMIRGVSALHPDLAFDFAMGHMPALDVRIDTSLRSAYYPALGENSLDASMIGKIRAYAAAHAAAGSRRAAETAAANVAYRIGVRDRQLKTIDAWLLQHAPPKIEVARPVG